MPQSIEWKDPNIAFDAAITTGRLNTDEHSYLYAGNWMYMGTDPNGYDMCKNIDTRKYLP